MRNILFIIIFFLSNPLFSQDGRYELDANKVISSKLIIFVSPSDKDIEKLKAKNEEDFYVIADDTNYYNFKAREFLDKKKFPYKFTEKRKIKFMIYNKITEIDYSDSKELWFVVIYNGKDKPIKTSSADVDGHDMFK